MAKKHKFAHTHVEHHTDGSHTVHHQHESGDPTKDVKHAAMNLDGVHDSLQDNLGTPNPGEAAANAGPAGAGAAAPTAGMPPAGAAPAGAI